MSGYAGTRIIVQHSNVTENFAGYNGGGLFSYQGQITLADSLVSNNSAVRTGGGIYQQKGNLTLDRVTMSLNEQKAVTNTAATGGCDPSAEWDVMCKEGTYILSVDRIASESIATSSSMVAVTGILDIRGVAYNDTDMSTYPKISGNDRAYMFYVPGGKKLRLFQITLEKGYSNANGDTDPNSGTSAVRVEGEVTITKCQIQNNEGDFQNGAAFYVKTQGKLIVVSSMMMNNVCSGKGGTFYSWGGGTEVDIINSTLIASSGGSNAFFSYRTGEVVRIKNSIINGGIYFLSHHTGSDPDLQLDNVEFQSDPGLKSLDWRINDCKTELQGCSFPSEVVTWFNSIDCNSTFCQTNPVMTTAGCCGTPVAPAFATASGTVANHGGGGVYAERNTIMTIRESTFDLNFATTEKGHQMMSFKDNSGTPSVTVVNTKFNTCDACSNGTNDFYFYDHSTTSGSAAAYRTSSQKLCSPLANPCTVAPFTGNCKNRTDDLDYGVLCSYANSTACSAGLYKQVVSEINLLPPSSESCLPVLPQTHPVHDPRGLQPQRSSEEWIMLLNCQEPIRSMALEYLATRTKSAEEGECSFPSVEYAITYVTDSLKARGDGSCSRSEAVVEEEVLLTPTQLREKRAQFF